MTNIYGRIKICCLKCYNCNIIDKNPRRNNNESIPFQEISDRKNSKQDKT